MRLIVQHRKEDVMALQLTQDNLRQIRYQLYQDQVFLVTHSALRILLRALDLVKLFVLAYKFTDGLLAHLPSEYDLMEYEVADIFRELNEELVADGKADVADEDVAFDGRLLLILSLVKLHALRHTDPRARPLSKLLLTFCLEYEGLRGLLGEFIVKEHQLRDQGKLVFLKRPRKTGVEPPLVDGGASALPPLLSGAREFVACFVANCKPLTADAIQHILVPLMTTNEQYGNAFDEEVNELKEKLGMKTASLLQPHVEGDFVLQKYVENEVDGVKKGAIGVIVKNIKDSGSATTK